MNNDIECLKCKNADPEKFCVHTENAGTKIILGPHGERVKRQIIKFVGYKCQCGHIIEND